jgi:DNA-binding NarL/FixJ family response regulator
MKNISIYIADDQIFVGPGLSKIIDETADLEVCGSTTQMDKILPEVAVLKPDVIVLDINWPGDKTYGIKLIEKIRAVSPSSRVVAISAYTELIEPAQAAGAFALEKGFTKANFLAMIRWAADSRTNHGTPASKDARDMDEEALTIREKEVLFKLALGRSNQEISGELGITIGTAKKHVSKILAKLGAQSRTVAVVIARRRGLTS